jgi:hypothetical protein
MLPRGSRLALRGLASKRQFKPKAAEPDVPELRATMRKLAFLVHPDRFSKLPAAAEENAVSLAALQGLLTTVQKQKDGHPPASIQRLRFHVYESGSQTRTVELLLKTTGGDCRSVVQRSLGQLFSSVGLPPNFRWGTGDWAVLSEETRKERDTRGGSEEVVEPPPPPPDPPRQEEPQARPARAAAAPPTDPIPLAEALLKLDPILAALACVPWLPPTEDGALRRHHLLHEALPALERDGWRLSRGAQKVWLGLRNAETLLEEERSAGLDAASGEALRALLFHTYRLEEELGAPLL